MGLVTRRLLEPSSQQKGLFIQTGTHAMGGNAGTITFPQKFEGTPSITTELIQGSSGFGRNEPFRTPSIFSGSFTYMGSPAEGTFAWTAIGP